MKKPIPIEFWLIWAAAALALLVILLLAQRSGPAEGAPRPHGGNPLDLVYPRGASGTGR